MAGPPVDYSGTLEVAYAEHTDLGEAPIWDDRTATLVFVDSNRGRIYRLRPGGELVSTTDVGQTIGAAIPRLSGGFVASSTAGLLSVTETTGEVGLLCPIETALPENRMNDAKCDAKGRLWSGTFSAGFAPGGG